MEQYSSWLPLTHGNVHLADDLEAFLGLGVVADDVAKADDMRGVLGANVVQHNLEGVQIAMNVCDNGVFHLLANNFKSPKFIFCFRPIYLLVADKSSKTCIVQRGAESVKLFARRLRRRVPRGRRAGCGSCR